MGDPDLMGGVGPARLESVISDLQALAASAAHELNGPLAAIRSSAEVLLTERHLPHQREFLEIIMRQVDSAAARANSLLDAARAAEHEAVAPVTGEVGQAVESAISEVEERLSTEAFPYDLTMSSRVEPGLIVPMAAIALTQILENLLWNAAKYGGQRATVEASTDGSMVTIMVCDDGQGIPADARADLFEAFTRGSNVDGVTGSGVGLATVATLVRRAGGSVQLLDTGPMGTTFVIRLPRVDGSAAA